MRHFRLRSCRTTPCNEAEPYVPERPAHNSVQERHDSAQERPVHNSVQERPAAILCRMLILVIERLAFFGRPVMWKNVTVQSRDCSCRSRAPEKVAVEVEVRDRAKGKPGVGLVLADVQG